MASTLIGLKREFRLCGDDTQEVPIWRFYLQTENRINKITVVPGCEVWVSNISRGQLPNERLSHLLQETEPSAVPNYEPDEDENYPSVYVCPYFTFLQDGSHVDVNLEYFTETPYALNSRIVWLFQGELPSPVNYLGRFNTPEDMTDYTECVLLTPDIDENIVALQNCALAPDQPSFVKIEREDLTTDGDRGTIFILRGDPSSAYWNFAYSYMFMQVYDYEHKDLSTRQRRLEPGFIIIGNNDAGVADIIRLRGECKISILNFTSFQPIHMRSAAKLH